MLIAMYLVIVNVIVPQLVAYAPVLLEQIMVIVITLSGIIMLFGAVGMKISNNLGSTVVNNFFRAIGYICRTIIQSVGWIIRTTSKMIPRVFNESRRTFSKSLGLSPLVSTLLAAIVSGIVLAIVI